MKKILSAVIVFCLMIFSANCQAQDVWIATVNNDDGSKTYNYIMTETIREDYNNLSFGVCVKAVSKGDAFITAFVFIYINGDWYSRWAYNGIPSPAGFELARNYLIPPKAFNACKPYVRLARKYPLY